jgi:hypothetical protein
MDQPLKVFKSASSFRRAAILLKEAHKQGDFDLLFPLATNFALAAELFMKCLLHLDQVRGRHVHSSLVGKSGYSHRHTQC